MNHLKNAFSVVKNNKTVIGRKAVIAVGAAAGMLITSTLVDRLGDRRISGADLNLLDPNEIVVIKDPESPTE